MKPWTVALWIAGVASAALAVYVFTCPTGLLAPADGAQQPVNRANTSPAEVAVVDSIREVPRGLPTAEVYSTIIATSEGGDPLPTAIITSSHGQTTCADQVGSITFPVSPPLGVSYKLSAAGYQAQDITDQIVRGGRHECRLSALFVVRVEVVDKCSTPLSGLELVANLKSSAVRGGADRHDAPQRSVSEGGIAEFQLTAGEYRIRPESRDYLVFNEDAKVQVGSDGSTTTTLQVGKVLLALIRFRPDTPRTTTIASDAFPRYASEIQTYQAQEYLRPYPGVAFIGRLVGDVSACPVDLTVECNLAGIGPAQRSSLQFKAPSEWKEPQTVEFTDLGLLDAGLVSLSIQDSKGASVAGCEVAIFSTDPKSDQIRGRFQLRAGEQVKVPPGEYAVSVAHLGDLRGMVTSIPRRVHVTTNQMAIVSLVLGCAVTPVVISVSKRNGDVPKYAIIKVASDNRELAEPYERTLRSYRVDNVPLMLPVGLATVTITIPNVCSKEVSVAIAPGGASPQHIEVKLDI